MTFEVSDTQRMVAETVSRLLEKDNDFEARRHRLAREAPEHLALWPKFVEAGITATLFPERAGGLGDSPRYAAVVMYQIGRSLAVEPYLAALVSGRILLACAPAVAGREIAAMLSGERIIVPAHEENINPFAPPAVKARYDGTGYHLHGVKPCIRHADIASAMIVTARLEASNELGCFLVESNAAGLQVERHRLIDAASGGRVSMDGAPARMLLSGPEAEQAMADAMSWHVAGLACEAAGIMDALNIKTSQYLRTRMQFGVALATFQALAHRLADMHIAAQEGITATDALLDQLEAGPDPKLSGLVSIVKVAIDRAGKRVSHEAVQMHGGMGVSDELDISHYMRRLACIRAEAGGEEIHINRFRDIAAHDGAIFGLDESPQATEYRTEVRAFVKNNLPAELARKVQIGLELTKDDYTSWEKILSAKGWFGVAWPAEHGGANWGLTRQLTFVQEAAINNAPMIMPYGVNMVGPVIHTFGTAAQKEKYLPDILASRTWWCQGYSEPNSGSDLASLKTFAALDGDHYVVNGTKMWTTEAHWADMMHCLVRTRRAGKPQEGITFLLIDMQAAGITVRPIITNDGQHHTNQIFLDNVRVPAENRVGEEGGGWKIAKFLLANERLAIADTGAKLRLLQQVKRLFGTYVAPSHAGGVTTMFQSRIAELEIQLAVLCMVERRYVTAWESGASRDGPEASLLKIRGTEILQLLAELALELEGPMAQIHDPRDLRLPPSTNFTPAQHASMMAHHYLYSRAWSIFGGTNEIQRNIIARFVLAQ